MSELGNNKPWYQHPMVWLVLAIPASSVIAGISFIYIAQRDANDVVNDNYYKQGLAINQSFAQDTQAQKLALSAHLSVEAGDLLVVKLQNAQQPFIRLDLSHSSDSDLDISGAMALALKKHQGGEYRYNLTVPLKGRWYVQLSGDDGVGKQRWRLGAKLDFPLPDGVTLLPSQHE